MEAKMVQREDISIVSISGYLDIERAQSFRNACTHHFQRRKIVLNMKDASFVGSTGIKPILETIQFLHLSSRKDFKLVGVKQEFLRLLTGMNIEMQELEIYEDEESAVNSYKNPDTRMLSLKLANLDSEENAKESQPTSWASDQSLIMNSNSTHSATGLDPNQEQKLDLQIEKETLPTDTQESSSPVEGVGGAHS